MVEPSIPGIRPCMTCGWLFVSPDRMRIGRCADCKSGREANYSPRAVNTHALGAARPHHKDTS